ncbi:uncharacterized protein LOC117180808 [Belonocnema kinseyi]|uniref:uncharacterized protein LOC117180808 n=1 Tax=Belonocnema kinseyi TaxID=2817044 RepID=UPI00143CDBE4|nr:uncharacterized protein LOC117180808 [Belonocnema kinseyi]
MPKLCISFSLATRLIGTFGLTVSILMINILATSFLSTEDLDQISATIESWTLFGLNWTFIVKKTQGQKHAEVLMICILLYAGISLIVNGLLSFASTSRKPQLTLPWICVQVINIIDQSIAIAVHLSCTDFSSRGKRSPWYMPISSMYLVLSAYFLIIVCAARKEWTNSSRENENIYISTITRTYDLSQGLNMPKSPSYIYVQNSFMESPKSMIESKYTQV